MRQEVWEFDPAYVRLCKKNDKQHEKMSLEDILRLSEKNHFLKWNGITWSVSGCAYSCKMCVKECVCKNNILLEMVLIET